MISFKIIEGFHSMVADCISFYKLVNKDLSNLPSCNSLHLCLGFLCLNLGKGVNYSDFPGECLNNT
jgi:hypothetical protein